MKEVEYSEAAVEVLNILNHTVKEDVIKIPQSFMRFLTNIASRSYKPRFNHEQPINGLNLQEKTKELLGFIYITWWSDEKEYEEYKKQIHDIKIKNEKNVNDSNLEDIFKLRKEQSNDSMIQTKNTIDTTMVKYKKENIFKKILNKIFNFFGVKKEGDKI